MERGKPKWVKEDPDIQQKLDEMKKKMKAMGDKMRKLETTVKRLKRRQSSSL